VDFLKHSEDELVFLVEAEGGGGQEDISDVSPSLSGVGVEGEEGVELGNGFRGEDGVLGSDVLGEDGLEFLLLNFLLAH
jgi:hypothetical protein